MEERKSVQITEKLLKMSCLSPFVHIYRWREYCRLNIITITRIRMERNGANNIGIITSLVRTSPFSIGGELPTRHNVGARRNTLCLLLFSTEQLINKYIEKQR